MDKATVRPLSDLSAVALAKVDSSFKGNQTAQSRRSGVRNGQSYGATPFNLRCHGTVSPKGVRNGRKLRDLFDASTNQTYILVCFGPFLMIPIIKFQYYTSVGCGVCIC
jgi:hypothetical protein